MTTDIPDFKSFMEKVEKLRKGGGVDLNAAEDLSLAVMNLISLEEHFFFTGAKTGKDKYFDHVVEIREMRKNLLARLMPNHEGETWCASKHLLSASMRLIETANRFQAEEKKEEAKKMYQDAYKIYSIFWGIRLDLLKVEKAKDIDLSKPLTLEDLVTKLADCCNE